jgi:hypothetical protein
MCILHRFGRCDLLRVESMARKAPPHPTARGLQGAAFLEKGGSLQAPSTLDVNKWALRRMERLVGRGRPVVPKARTLLEEIEDKLNDIVLLFDRHTPSIVRRRALRNWPCWPEYVEALYRGEHFKAKESGVKSPSEEAKRSVGRALGIVRGSCPQDLWRRPAQTRGPAQTNRTGQPSPWLSSRDGLRQMMAFSGIRRRRDIFCGSKYLIRLGDLLALNQ